MKNWTCYLRETFVYTHCRRIIADTEEEAIIIMERLYDKGAFKVVNDSIAKHEIEVRAYPEMPVILEGKEG